MFKATYEICVKFYYERMKKVNIKQNELEGVYLGISSKEGVILFDPSKKLQNHNWIITAQAGVGMSYINKAMLFDQLSKTKHLVVIDPKD